MSIGKAEKNAEKGEDSARNVASYADITDTLEVPGVVGWLSSKLGERATLFSAQYAAQMPDNGRNAFLID